MNFEHVWNQVNQSTPLSNSTQVITDTDIVIKNTEIILPNREASLYPIHLISQAKSVNIIISNCLMKGVKLLLDNANISLHIENSTFTAAGISIQSEENTEHLPVKIKSCHFSGHFPEDTLLFDNTENVAIESCYFTDLWLNNNESSIIKALHSSLYIDHSIFTKNRGSLSIVGGSSQIINCSFTKSRSCLKAKETTVNISMSQFHSNTHGCIYGHNAILDIVDSNLTTNRAKANGGAVYVNKGQVSLSNCLLINNTAEWDGGAVCAGNSNVTLGNCSLINNTAQWGGAVCPLNSNVTLGNCSLINNTAQEWGGAVCPLNSTVTLGNCSLINNTAGEGGGAVSADNSTVTLGNCSLINNTAQWVGAVLADNSHVSLGNCSLINNKAVRWGGAVMAANSNVTLGELFTGQ